MKNIFSYVLVFLCFMSVSSRAAAMDRFVTNQEDSNSDEGTLRVILQDACRTAGDDVITFIRSQDPEFRVRLSASLGPLVIPEDCQGRVTLTGSTEVDTILDAIFLRGGGNEPGDSCALNVYSHGHTIRGLHFMNTFWGTGLCLFGQDNIVKENRMESNRYGIVVSDVFQNDSPDMNGNGNVLQGNTIQSNSLGGVIVMGATTKNVEITRNVIFNNGDINLDLNHDGVTFNDLDDSDEGANHLLNHADYFQAFPMVTANDGSQRYWGWGVSLEGSRVELFQVAEQDRDAGIYYGGVDEFLGDLILTDMTFSVDPVSLPLLSNQMVTTLTFDDDGNTSEYALNVAVGADSDMDGVLDEYETGDGTTATLGSSMHHVDSDGDGVPDGVEDENRNGVWDQDLGETAAYKADSDDDGVNDGSDTLVLQADADGDGLADSAEDRNHNGIWEAYLGETSTHLADSDGDGLADDVDNCPAVSNPGGEAWYCQT